MAKIHITPRMPKSWNSFSGYWLGTTGEKYSRVAMCCEFVHCALGIKQSKKLPDWIRLGISLEPFPECSSQWVQCRSGSEEDCSEPGWFHARDEDEQPGNYFYVALGRWIAACYPDVDWKQGRTLYFKIKPA